MTELPTDASPVAPWEVTSLAIMLIATHGDDAEAHSHAQLEAAICNGHAGDRVLWSEVVKRLPDVRLMRSANG